MEGLWTLEFDNYGLCLFFQDGRIYGGSGNYYWLGTYTLESDTINGHLTATHYTGDIDPLFDTGTIEVDFTATVSGDRMEGTGKPVSLPVEFPFVAARRGHPGI